MAAAKIIQHNRLESGLRKHLAGVTSDISGATGHENVHEVPLDAKLLHFRWMLLVSFQHARRVFRRRKPLPQLSIRDDHFAGVHFAGLRDAAAFQSFAKQGDWIFRYLIFNQGSCGMSKLRPFVAPIPCALHGL
jgi:hypothetical protein